MTQIIFEMICGKTHRRRFGRKSKPLKAYADYRALTPRQLADIGLNRSAGEFGTVS